MDHIHSTTDSAVRQKGRHLTSFDRGQIKALRKTGKFYRDIAQELNCSPSTVCYELKRGTPPRTGRRGRPKSCSPQLGEAVYREHRRNCHRHFKATADNQFIIWAIEKMLKEHYSPDACVGEARREHLFAESEILCTRSLYNAIWGGRLPVTPLDLLEAAGRRKRKKKGQAHKHKKLYGKSIEERPEAIASCSDFGHWEIDTVVGHKKGKEAAVLTLLEMRSRMYLAMKIPAKNSESVMAALAQLRDQYGSSFCSVFKSITADNGAEFSDLSSLEKDGTQVYFAHPYSSWERAKNERHNRMLRRYIPKGVSIENFSASEVCAFANSINNLPRKILQYETPEAIFHRFLASVMTK